MPTRTDRSHEWLCHLLCTPEGWFTNLWRQKKPSQEHVFVLRPHSLALQCLCPAPQETGERRGDRKRAGNERERDRQTGSLTSYRSVQPLPAPQVRSRSRRFSSRYCSPASPLEMDVVASYHLGPFTPRIKPLACLLLVLPLQRAATVDTKAFKNGLTTQSHEY